MTRAISFLVRDIPADLHHRLKVMCIRTGVPMREAMLQAILMWVKKKEKGEDEFLRP